MNHEVPSQLTLYLQILQGEETQKRKKKKEKKTSKSLVEVTIYRLLVPHTICSMTILVIEIMY